MSGQARSGVVGRGPLEPDWCDETLVFGVCLDGQNAALPRTMEEHPATSTCSVSR